MHRKYLIDKMGSMTMKMLTLPRPKTASLQAKKVIDPVIQRRLDALDAVAGIFSKKQGAEWLKHAKKVRAELDRGY